MALTLEQADKLAAIEANHNAQLKVLGKGFQVANVFTNRYYLDGFSNADIYDPGASGDRRQADIISDPTKLQIYRMTKIVLDKDEDVNDKLTSVFNALNNLAITVAVYIVGSGNDIQFFFATRSEELSRQAGNILESSLRSNFPGIELSNLNNNEARKFLQDIDRNQEGISMLKSLTTVSLVPSIRNKEKKEQYVQGMEKFINTLRGKNYVAIFLATPVSTQDITIRKNGYEELFSALSPYAKLSIAYGESVSDAVNTSVSRSFTKSVNDSVSDSNSNSTSNTDSRSVGRNSGFNINDKGWGFSSGSSTGQSTSFTSGTSLSHSISHSVGISNAETITEGGSKTSSSSETKTLNFENKGISNLMKKIETQLERIATSESYGLWESCAYFFSNDISVSISAATTYKAIMTGEKTGVEKAHVNVWGNSGIQGIQVGRIMNNVKHLVHPCAKMLMPEGYKGNQEQFVTPTSLVSGPELSFLLGIPRKSVPGVAVQEMAEFGRAVVYESKIPEKTISIGNIYHMGIEEKNMPVPMDLNLFSSHCFITGSSGSGKSYATYNLLDRLIDNGVKILVVEPAKGEYKMVFGNLRNVNIFSTDVNTYRLLRINPFQFPEKIHILSHIEQLMQIFNASWSLYDAMPAILKDSIVRSYVKCGWDIQNSLWIRGINDHRYPIFEDILSVLPQIIDTSDYSDEVKGNYKGALITRLQSMTTGLNGMIFKKSEGIKDEILFDNNAIVDLSDVGSEETIALLMGTLIMRLGEYRKSVRKAGKTASHDSQLTHVTVLEEAHNLLKRTNKDQNQEGANMVGKSVAMISNSIKEMRTYGEGFLIIDQSPLAVDSSVVENTSTKIIMNTPSKEACEELGSALSLRENQTRELSRLNVGVAAIMQKGWMTPVLMKVGKWDSSRYEAELQSENLNSVKFVRSSLASELYKQIQENKYSVMPMGEIIRKSDLDADRKEELLEITTLYSSFKEQSLKLTDEMLGKLFIEIINCEGLFYVIPNKGVLSFEALDERLENGEDEEDEEALVNEMSFNAQVWLNTFRRSLNQYVSIKPEVAQCAVKYMLAAKGKSGEDTSSIFGHLYYCLSTGDIE